MDNHKVFCGLIIFLQITDLTRGFTYNFSLCNHNEIQEDLINVLDLGMTFTKEELELDFHTCEEAPSPPAGPQQSEDSRRAGRLLECVLERAWGCGERPQVWHRTVSIVQRHCPGYGPPRGRSGSSSGRVRSQGSSAQKTNRSPCDERKARELMAVWRSYMNLG